MPTRFRWISLSVLLGLLMIPSVASAHAGHATTSGFASGFSHPLFGLDHLAAMLAVGLWAGQLGKKAQWLVPASFVGVMLLGGVLGMFGLESAMIEPAILSSVLVLGALIAMAAQAPLGVSMAVVGTFALFHGLAHGLEVPTTANGFSYAAGFTLATALLHVSGLAFSVASQQLFKGRLVQIAGLGLAVLGSVLLLG
jgi:urease accessory protein